MGEIRGPYPDDNGFQRWTDDSSTYRRLFDDDYEAVVTYLPGGDGNAASREGAGWGYVMLFAGMVIGGKFHYDWTAQAAMYAACRKHEELRAEQSNGDT